MATQETWISSDAAPAIKNDIAPVGYAALHVHRLQSSEGPKRGGSLAIVHRNTVVVRDHPFPPGSAQPSSFELRLVRITSTKGRSVIVGNIHRPPRCSVPEFLDKLADIFATICTSSDDRLLPCGEVNCPGLNGACVGNGLASLLDSLRLEQLVSSPTPGDNIFNILRLTPSAYYLMCTWTMPVVSPTTGWSSPASQSDVWLAESPSAHTGISDGSFPARLRRRCGSHHCSRRQPQRPTRSPINTSMSLPASWTWSHRSNVALGERPSRSPGGCPPMQYR